MIRAKLVVAAENIVIDKEVNRASLFNVLDSCKAPGFPLALPPFVVLAITERDLESDPAEVDLRINIGVAGGKRLSETTARINYLDQKTNRLTLRVVGLVMPGPGTLHFDVYYVKKRLGRYSVNFDHLDKPEIKAESGAAKKKGRKRAKETTKKR